MSLGLRFDRRLAVAILAAVLLVIAVGAAFALMAEDGSAVIEADAAQILLVQDQETEVAVLPGNLERLSWGAVLAGAIVALVIQLALNLLALSVGATRINPQVGEDSASPKSLAVGGAVWVAVSALIALFVGGWVSAHFSGQPEDIDGVLHGLTTWAVVTLLTLFLVTTSIGRILSGTSALIGTGLSIAARAAEVTARGAANVAGAAVQGAATVASGAANAAGQAAVGAATMAREAAGSAGNAAQQALDNSPELQEVLRRQNVSRERIMEEGRRLLDQAGVSADQVQREAGNAAREVRGAVAEARQHPTEAVQIMTDALNRVFQRGQAVVSQADRDALVDVLMQRGNLSPEDATNQLDRWEATYNETIAEVEQTRQNLMARASQIPNQVNQRVQQVEQEVRDRVDQARYQVENTARDVAQATADAIAGIAAALFAAIVISGIAAGIGGWLGAPEALPTAEVDVEDVPTSFSFAVTYAGLED